MIPLYQKLAVTFQAYENCVKNGNEEWGARHLETIQALEKNHLPSGSGFDAGTLLDIKNSHSEKLVFHTSFHHMDQHGTYDGWTSHKVTVRGNLAFGFTLKVSGKNRNDVKELIADMFDTALRVQVE